MTVLNCENKMTDMDKILLSWSRRDTTLAGRILIIKSLALSKPVHFFISLPSPPKQFMRDLNKKFYSFLWKSKPPKVKSSAMESDIKQGGLKMVIIYEFEQLLKVKWLKNILTKNESWTSIPIKYGIDQVLRFGNDYANNLLAKIDNPFWRSVAYSVGKTHEIYDNNNKQN